MTTSTQDASISLAGRLAATFGSILPKRQDNIEAAESLEPDVAAIAVAPLPLVDALSALSSRCGYSVTRDMLMAAMPLIEGDLDPRFAPAALGRAGLEARWEHRRLFSLRTTDLPALALLSDGGCVLLTAVRGRDFVEIADGEASKVVPIAALAGRIDARILVCGHADPQNGLSADEEQGLTRRNPKLWLMGLFLGERRQLKYMLLAGLLMNVTALAIPLYMRAIYDRVVPNLAIESLWALSIGVVIVLVFELVLKKLRSSFVDAIGIRVGQAVQHRAMLTLLKARVSEGERSPSGLMTALRDVESLALLVPLAIVTWLVDVPFFFAFLGLIGLIAGWTVAGPVVCAIALGGVGLVAAHALKLAGVRGARLMQARNDLIADVAEGRQTIKANGAEGRMLRQWDIVSDHIGVSTQTARNWNELPTSVSGFLVQFVTVTCVVIGVFQIKAGMMTAGALVAVVMLASRAIMPVTAAVGVTSRLYQSLSQIDGLAAILALEPERDASDPAIRPDRAKGDIGLRNVSFRYPQSPEASLRELSLTIRQGERVALIGRSGSGKSTLLRLLAGMAEPTDGALTLDGHALGQYAPSQLRQGVVYAAQDARLFDTTIWDNILLGLHEPDADTVEQAINASGIDGFVARTVEGYARKVGPDGSCLSGGQRQAIVLARALIRDPNILLLDEPTASMDINAERQVVEGLRRFAESGRTVIVATHRMALLDLVERVIWLDEGRVIADKPKLEVLAMMRNQQQAA
jgi:ATP-binding cassette subfamily C protein LapB